MLYRHKLTLSANLAPLSSHVGLLSLFPLFPFFLKFIQYQKSSLAADCGTNYVLLLILLHHPSATKKNEGVLISSRAMILVILRS